MWSWLKVAVSRLIIENSLEFFHISQGNWWETLFLCAIYNLLEEKLQRNFSVHFLYYSKSWLINHYLLNFTEAYHSFLKLNCLYHQDPNKNVYGHNPHILETSLLCFLKWEKSVYTGTLQCYLFIAVWQITPKFSSLKHKHLLSYIISENQE